MFFFNIINQLLFAEKIADALCNEPYLIATICTIKINENEILKSDLKIQQKFIQFAIKKNCRLFKTNYILF